MITVIQRVNYARVLIDQQITARIGHGVLALVGIEKTDGSEQADKLLHKILHYRIFEDAEGKMNQSVQDIQGGVLLVPQFTLAADTRKGLRPSFSKGATPVQARQIFTDLCDRARQLYPQIECGVFGADMQISLENNGPVSFILQVCGNDG